MKTLEDIPKNNIFEVPAGYFDHLPLRVQNRIETTKEKKAFFIWKLSIRYAVPAIALVFGLLYLFQPEVEETEVLLAAISNEHLIAYLKESDISENDLLEVANFNELDADSLNRHIHIKLLGDIEEQEVEGALENEL